MMIDKLDPMAAGGQRNKAKPRDINVARSSLSFVGLGDDPFGKSLLELFLSLFTVNVLSMKH